jgi:succinate dehydrogenase / fumarate reductase cytochrome b subunit
MTVPLAGGRYHFLLRRLHSLTGIIFGGYLVVHLIVNATIAQVAHHGPGGTLVYPYQQQVDKIHSLPWLPIIEWTFIYLPIIYHAVYGTWIIFTGQPNLVRYPYFKNWYYLLQRISAVIIVAFILFHVLSLKYGLFGANLTFDPENAQHTILRHLQYNPILSWVVYTIGVLASCFHTANGFWTAGITWGLTVSAGGQRRWGYMCLLIFALLFSAGMLAIVAGTTRSLH